MNPYLRRLGHTLLVLWVVVTGQFLMFRLMPGDPMHAFINDDLPIDIQQAVLQRFGLDQPLHVQYWLYMGNLLRGDLGVSFFHRIPVTEVLMSVFVNSIVLTLTGLIVAYVFGTLMGALIAWKRGSWVEAVSIPVVLASRAAPEFWVGMVLIALVSFKLGWLPSGGANSAGASFDSEFHRLISYDFLSHLALPALTLALYIQGLPLLLMRSSMIEVLQEEFITMARMKGLSKWSIAMRHAARNALLPVATAFALGLGATVGGNVIVETVFSWPGIGRMLVSAVSSSDYPLIQGAFLMISVVLILMNFIADLLYTWLDPRVAHAGIG